MPYIGQDIADVAVTVGQGVITATQIQDASITTADIGNDAITPNKVDDDGTGFQMGSLGLGTAVSGSEKLTVGGTASFSGNITGTLATASQTNITSVGTLSSLNVAGQADIASDTYPQLDIDGTDNSGNIGFTFTGSGARGGMRWNSSNNDVEILREGGGVEISLLDGGGTTFANTITVGASDSDKEVKVNRSRMRHIDGLADANDYSHGDLYLNHISTGTIYMQRNSNFAGNVELTGTSGQHLKFADDSGSSWSGNHAKIQHHNSYMYLQGGSSGIILRTNSGTNAFTMDSSGNTTFTGDITIDAGSGNPDLVIKTTADSNATAQALFLTGDKDFTLINDTANFRLYNSTPGVGVDVFKVIGSSSDILLGDVGNSRHVSLDYSNGDFVVNQTLGVGAVPDSTNIIHAQKDQSAFTRILVENESTSTTSQALLGAKSNAGVINIGMTPTQHSFGGDAILWNTANTGMRFATNNTGRFSIDNEGRAEFQHLIYRVNTAQQNQTNVMSCFHWDHPGTDSESTFDFNPVLDLGLPQTGGSFFLKISGWMVDRFFGLVTYRNNGGVGDISSGADSLDTIVNDGFNVGISRPSGNTIRITLSGQHNNNHGWDMMAFTAPNVT